MHHKCSIWLDESNLICLLITCIDYPYVLNIMPLTSLLHSNGILMTLNSEENRREFMLNIQLWSYDGYSDSNPFKQIFGSWKNLLNETKPDLLFLWNIWSLKAGIGIKLWKTDLITSHVTLWNAFQHAHKTDQVNRFEQSTQYKILLYSLS